MIQDEVWKDIEGYEGLYQVSNFGNIKSLARIVHSEKRSDYKIKEKVLKQSDTTTGYKKVELHKDNKKRKSFKVHRLVAQAFIPNPENKREVNHIDGNKHNNNVNNLEWVTSSENKLHAFEMHLNPTKRDLDEEEIIRMYCEEKMSIRQIAKEFNVADCAIIRRLKANDIEIKSISEQKLGFDIDKVDLKEELKNKSKSQLARELGCSRVTIYKHLK